MRGRERFSPPPVGSTSLMGIFGILVLAVLAVLSLTTALADQRLSDAAAQSVSAYYEADNRAEEIFARLRQGELPEGVQVEGNLYCFRCPISHNQQLEAVLRKDSGGWTVLRWQAVALPQTGDENTNLWNGGIP